MVQPPTAKQIHGKGSHVSRAREVLAVLDSSGPLTYEQLHIELKPPVTYNRITALVSEMIRDGISLKREGKPVKVSLKENVTGSNSFPLFRVQRISVLIQGKDSCTEREEDQLIATHYTEAIFASRRRCLAI